MFGFDRRKVKKVEKTRENPKNWNKTVQKKMSWLAGGLKSSFSNLKDQVASSIKG